MRAVVERLRRANTGARLFLSLMDLSDADAPTLKAYAEQLGLPIAGSPRFTSLDDWLTEKFPQAAAESLEEQARKATNGV